MSEHIKLTDYKNLVSLLSVPLLPVCNLRKSPLPLILGAEGQISRRSVPLLPELRSSLRSDLSLCSKKTNYKSSFANCPSALRTKKIAASRRFLPLFSTIFKPIYLKKRIGFRVFRPSFFFKFNFDGVFLRFYFSCFFSQLKNN